jgi:adenosylmethionine---8-amino-7-oxononanoate aminotransferase
MSDLLRKDKQYVWHPFTQMKTADVPLEIISAKGARLYAADGKSYIDANSSWWVNVHGHGNPVIGEAISEQFQELDHVIFAGVTHPTAVQLAEDVIQLLGNPFEKVFFSDDGSTAVEVALKMAFQYWYNSGNPKKRILAMDGAYHGDTFGAMAIGQRGYFNEPFEHFFFDVDFLEFPTEVNSETELKKAEKLFESGEFAAMIVEPLVQGSAGMRMYSVEFLAQLVRLAKKHDVLVIYDEVMTGWGRTGKLFAMEHCAVRPDIICLSKGLTGGVLPLGLTVSTIQIYNAFLSEEKTKALLHGHSFTGNALSCAAAVASIGLFRQKETNDNIETISAAHQVFIEKMKGNPAIDSIRSLGTILAVDLKVSDSAGYFSSIRDEAYQFMLSKGILMRPLGNCLFVNPPYCIEKDDLDSIYSALESFVSKHNS